MKMPPAQITMNIVSDFRERRRSLKVRYLTVETINSDSKTTTTETKEKDAQGNVVREEKKIDK